MEVKIYGIKNCNTMQKAFQKLDEMGIKYHFHDYKKLGIDADTLQKWASQVGYEKLINKSGMTWKKLDDVTKASVVDQKSAISLLIKNTSMIKRPVVEKENKIILGFDEKIYASML